MEELNHQHLIKAAREFCKAESNVQKFQEFLSSRYKVTIGSSANGLDLPSINTDIKVTSIKQPQSSCPYKDSKQKIFGLGYNLIVFVYQKNDDTTHKTSALNFVSCSFIEAGRTADYQTTTGLRKIIQHKIPADEVTLMQMAEQILKTPPQIGYLTISNALQWRLQYNRIVHLEEKVEGITPIVKYE
ncbi:MAG: restriction endonuclease [Phocaeicola vulgatus]|nr:restriction endonuclease [Phocaeicola vulgatus]